MAALSVRELEVRFPGLERPALAGLGFLATRIISNHLAADNGIGLPVTFIAADGWAFLALLLAYRHSLTQALRG